MAVRLPPASLVLPAAGESSRLPGRVRKPFQDLCGRPVLVRTLEAFRALSFVREAVLLVHPEELVRVKRDWSRTLRALKVSWILPGGSCRAESVAIGVRATSPSSRLVLVHDAARPLVGAGEIRSVAREAALRGAAILALPASDTLKRVSASRGVAGGTGWILNTCPRNGLWLAQTPQAFRRGLLIEACSRWLQSRIPREPTDEASLLEGVRRVRVLRGSGDNFKISTRGDLERARILWNSRS